MAQHPGLGVKASTDFQPQVFTQLRSQPQLRLRPTLRLRQTEAKARRPVQTRFDVCLPTRNQGSASYAPSRSLGKNLIASTFI